MRVRCDSCQREQDATPGQPIERCCTKPKLQPIASSKPKAQPSSEGRQRYRSKTEAAYAAHLEMEKRAGTILDWKHEAVRLRLANGVWFLPDFLVRLPDGQALYHEVKGRGKNGRYFTREKGRLKVRVAAETFPFWRFIVVWPLGNGAWGREAQ